MATPASTRRERPDASVNRAQPPIRWPHPDRRSLGMVAVWALGLLVALLVPAAIVSPTAENPPAGAVLLAFGTTVIGALIMLAATAVLWRRSKDSSVMLLGVVPAIACVAGGIILAGAKLGAV